MGSHLQVMVNRELRTGYLNWKNTAVRKLLLSVVIKLEQSIA